MKNRINYRHLSELVKECFQYYQDMLDNPIVNNKIVKNSIPILFFGDLKGYEKSELKIITVGLNPSNQEFPEDKIRFSIAKDLYRKNDAILNDVEVDNYLQSLYEYFDLLNDKYDENIDNAYNWFYKKPYSSLLEGLDASYDIMRNNRVIHTDICTPIPTNPTWSGLGNEEKSEMKEKGNEIWEKLISILQPDIILLSCKDDYWKDLNGFIDYKNKSKIFKEYKTTVNGEEYKKGSLRLYEYLYQYGAEKNDSYATVYIDSKPNQIPFMNFGGERSKESGKEIRKRNLKKI